MHARLSGLGILTISLCGRASVLETFATLTRVKDSNMKQQSEEINEWISQALMFKTWPRNNWMLLKANWKKKKRILVTEPVALRQSWLLLRNVFNKHLNVLKAESTTKVIYFTNIKLLPRERECKAAVPQVTGHWRDYSMCPLLLLAVNPSR